MHVHGLTPGHGSNPGKNHNQSATETEEQITTHTAVYSGVETAKCWLHADSTQIKDKYKNKELTTGVNKALLPKTSLNGGLSASFGGRNFLKIGLLLISELKDKQDLFLSCWMLYNSTTAAVPKHQCGLWDSKNCNLKFTGFGNLSDHQAVNHKHCLSWPSLTFGFRSSSGALESVRKWCRSFELKDSYLNRLYFKALTKRW